jgi:AcrR family transcriptional regulator
MKKERDNARRDFMRTEILRVAERLFAENGIKHTSMGQLAEAMGMTRAALYHYFTSKEDLVEQALQVAIDRYWIFDSVEESMSVNEAAEVLIRRRYQQVREAGPTDLRFFYTAILEQLGEDADAQMMRIILDAHRESMKRVLAGAISRGEIDPSIDAQVLVNRLTAMIIGTDLLWLVDRDGVDLAEESEVIARGFVDLVRGGQPSSQASAQPDR